MYLDIHIWGWYRLGVGSGDDEVAKKHPQPTEELTVCRGGHDVVSAPSHSGKPAEWYQFMGGDVVPQHHVYWRIGRILENRQISG